MNKEDLKIYLIFIFAFILGICVDYLFYGKPVGISFFVFTLVFIIFALTLAKKFGQKLTKIQYILLIPIILLSAGVFLRSSSFLLFFNKIGTIYLIFIFFTLFSTKNILEFHFLQYLILPLSSLKKSFQKSASLFDKFWDLLQAKRKLGSLELQGVIRGIIISLPILAIFTLLFASADIVFQKYLDELSKIDIETEIILRTLIVLVSSYFFVGFLAKIFEDRKFETHQLKSDGAYFLGSIESSVILILVNLLFLIFILIQFFYLFGGKSYVWGIEEYITYSEYAKKGFGELIIVSILSFFLIYGIDKFGKKESLDQEKVFKILSSTLTFELFAIMASAFKRLSLYVDGYGYTFDRILSFTFLFWLFFAFLLFLYKIFSGQRENFFLYSLFWLTVLFLIGMNIFNPDAFIAKKNIERYLQGKQLDIWYFNQLSDDAVPEIVKIFRMDVEDEIKIDIAMSFNDRYKKYYYPPYQQYYPLMDEEGTTSFDERIKEIREKQKWQSFNLSQSRAFTVLLENSREIKKYQAKYWEKEEMILD